jgi:hypothetical protein
VSGGYSPLTAESRVRSQAGEFGIFGHKVALGQVFLGLREVFPSCIIPGTLHIHIYIHIHIQIHIHMHVFHATGKFVPLEVGEYRIENKLQYKTTHLSMNPSHTMLGLFLLNEDYGD